MVGTNISGVYYYSTYLKARLKMNDIERIQAILVTLLEAAQRGGLHPEIAEPMHDDLMNKIVNQSDSAVDLIARRLIDVANHE